MPYDLSVGRSLSLFGMACHDPLTLTLAAGSAVAGLAGTMTSARAAEQQGQAAERSQQMQALALERQAREREAASQREAITRAKQTDVAASRAQAVAAASGGGATDPTVLDIVGDIEQQGAYNQASALYEGTTAARGLDEAAALARYRGSEARRAGKIASQATMLSGISSFASSMSRFGGPHG